MLNRSYEDVYDFSISKPEEFWNEIAKEVHWMKPYTNVLENKLSYFPKWFFGGEINMSYNCLDEHVENGFGSDIAIIHDSPITGSTQSLTYDQLLASVSLLAGVMVDRCGIMKGDIILLYFPVIPECIISMLACTRIGAPYVVVYGGFSAKELAKRISYTKPKMMLTCNVGADFGALQHYKEKLESALEICDYSPKYCLVYNRPNFKPAPMNSKKDLDWATEMCKSRPQDAVPLESNHPMFLIFTSGTTGEPKCLVHSTGNLIVSYLYVTKYIFSLKPRDTFWGISNFGWILGQSLMSYGSLLSRVRTIIYEGRIIGCPDNAQFGRVMNWYKVNVVTTTPTVMRILQRYCSKSDLELNYKGLSYIVIGGEVSDKNVRQWTSETFHCEVRNGWGQTELGGVMTMSRLAFKMIDESQIDNEFILRPPGLHMIIVDRTTGMEVPRGVSGRIVVKLPVIPSLSATLYKNEERFRKTYFDRYPGYLDTMDAGFMRDDGSIKVECREDDVIHVGAARISSSAVEEACLQNEDISEAVVIPLDDEILGTVPFAFLICKHSVTKSDEEVVKDTVNIVKDIVGEVACFQQAVIVPEMPKTINGKVHRSSLASKINGREFTIPTLVDNTHAYLVIFDILSNAGYKPSLPK